MSVQSRQALRLLKFVAELKKNNFTNATRFMKILNEAVMDGDIPGKCRISERTILRDIKTLKNDYGAPIQFDHANNGYFLTNPDWILPIPVLDDDEILSMAMLGTRLSSDILPEPVKSKSDSAMDKLLSGNCSKFFDDAMIQSILCSTGIKSAVDPKVFGKIFTAWRMHQVVNLTYHKPNSSASTRCFEPHILAFRNGVWYTKGYEKGVKTAKVYAIQRITGPEFAGDTFVSDKKLIDDTRKNGLFMYPKISGIRLRCDASIAFYLREHQPVKKFRIESQDDGSLVITLQPAVEHEVIRWVLGESGRIEVLYPPELRAKVASAARLIWERNQLPAAAPEMNAETLPEVKTKTTPVKAKTTAENTPAAPKTVKAKSAPSKRASNLKKSRPTKR